MKILRSLLSVAMIVVVFFVLKKTTVVRLYPVCVNAVFLTVFGVTLLPLPRWLSNRRSLLGRDHCEEHRPPFRPLQPMVFRLACIQDKTIAFSPHRDDIRRYCRRVTYAWCVFFIVNGGAALWTAMRGSDGVWSVYNGIVAYILMGTMFAVEYIIRRQVNAKMTQIHTITKFNAASWPLERVMCFDGTYSGGEKKTWRDFLVDTAKLRSVIDGGASAIAGTMSEASSVGEDNKTQATPTDWVLHCDDYWYFLCAFVALLQCKKRILLTQNTTPQFMAEVRKPGDGFITDIEDFATSTIKGEATSSDGHTIYVPTYLSSAPEPANDAVMTTPPIDSDATQILMFTSGSTGHAKAVHQRMTEFEADNAFVISKWGGEFNRRALVSTVSAHHIYGFLFGVSMPFSLGVPFRRKRVKYPEEFEALTDLSYMIIAVPAFLKRAVEAFPDTIDGQSSESLSSLPNAPKQYIEAASAPATGLHLRDPFMFTSGGAVPFDVAEKTAKVVGVWPVEVYGSTETSGIAWRVSLNGMEWTPFDNARVWRGDDGCLVIVSPYIKDPAGFATSDLVEMKDDGRFLLLGRADSIVKIEEKRVCLTEVEKRLMQTGLVSDAKVVAMEDKRQYLAAAVVLNNAGRDKFMGKQKLEINQYFHAELMKSMENVVIPKRWRYVDAIPCDTQGKRRKEDVLALFQGNDHGVRDEVVTAKSENMVQVEFNIPADSDFFDGHFPEFHLLPAVAQFELVTRFAKKYLGLQRYVPKIRRIKFSAPILPGTMAVLKLEYNSEKGSVVYSLWDAKTNDIYSTGSFSALKQEASL